jgi:hypothetical protein
MAAQALQVKTGIVRYRYPTKEKAAGEVEINVIHAPERKSENETKWIKTRSLPTGTGHY